MNFSNLLKVSLIASGLSLPFLSIDVQAGNLENPNGITIVAENDSVAQLQDVLPLDDGVIHGKLENGLTYYIRQNKEPKDRVTMYLAIKVGSILESEPQRGLAHFLEHMNFNGLKHFPKNELVNYLQSAGVRFGSDLNAYTSFDETVYQLPIPSDDPELLKNGLQVIRDWAQDALLEGEEIDKERGVILEEMRGGRGANQRMQDQFLPMLLNNSRYANRLPIGTEDVVSGFPHEEIRKFHADWYRPDLMSVIIVGDIDEQEMKGEIERLFSDMRMPENPPVRSEYKVDLKGENQYMVVTDEEMPQTIGQIIIKMPNEKVTTVGQYRQSLIESVLTSMINSRISELSQSSNPPFIGGGVEMGRFLANLDNFSVFFAAKPGAIEEGFRAIYTELERVRQFGFSESELNRTIASMRKSNETSYIERDKKKSDAYVNSYLNHFLKDAPALSNEYRYELMNQLLPTITLEEVEKAFLSSFVDENRDILFLGPEGDKDKMPKEEEVLAWVSEIQKEQLTAYEDNVSDLPLLASQPVAGKIVKESKIDGIETSEIVLSNGVKVYLKPTTYKNNEIVISAFSPGGTSLYSDEDYLSASNAASLINSSGLGQYNNVEIKKYLADKRVNVSPSISERYESLSGYSDKDGLETAFEMIYGYFTEPRIEDDVFQSFITSTRSNLANQGNNPQYVFGKEITEALYNNSIRRTPMSLEKVDQINKDRAFEIFKERFADASDFTFVIVGSFDEEEIKPLLEQYLAALPTVDRKDEPRDLGLYEPNKGFNKDVYKGKEEKVNVNLAYYTDYDYNDKNNINVSALSSVLSIKLIEILREEEGGVYGVGAQGSYSKEPKPRLSLNIGFGTSPEKVDKLIELTKKEINRVKTEGPNAEDVQKFIIERERQFQVQQEENGFWLNNITSALRMGEDPTKFLNYLDRVRGVTPETIKDVAKKYLDEDKLFQFILHPDKKEN